MGHCCLKAIVAAASKTHLLGLALPDWPYVKKIILFLSGFFRLCVRHSKMPGAVLSEFHAFAVTAQYNVLRYNKPWPKAL